jgi:hypothetical protein
MKGGKMTIKAGTPNAPNMMKGLFWGNFIESEAYTNWYQDVDCDNACQPAPPVDPCLPTDRKVTSFTLVNATTDQDIGPLNNGDVINLAFTGPISVRANVCSEANIESVKFQLNGNDYKKENIPFYTIAGDNNGNYNPWNIQPGVYTITAIPYSGDNATGTVGTSLSVTITIIGSSAKSEDEQSGGAISDGNEIEMNAYPNPFSERLNIEFTLTEDSRVNLEVFNLSGQRIGSLFEGNVKAGEMTRVEFRPATVSKGFIIYRLQTERGIYFGKAVMTE